MAKYTWPTPDRHSSAITSVRMRNEAKARISGLDNYATADTRDAALAELLATTSEVFNVKAYGAKGDGSTDDAAAIQAALDAAEGSTSNRQGGTVYMPGVDTNYIIKTPLEIPVSVHLVGDGTRATRIKWGGSTSPAVAVVTSNLTGQYTGTGHVFSNSIRNLRIDCNGEGIGIKVCGWNEYCSMSDIEVIDFVTTGFYFSAVTPATDTNPTQNANFERLRAISSDAGSNYGFRLSAVNLCKFDQLTVDAPSGGSNGSTVGIRIDTNSHGNTFLVPNLEECDLAFDIGDTSACEMNTIINPNWSNNTYTASGQTIGSITDETIGILVRTGTSTYVIISARDGGGSNRDHAVYDVDRDRSWVGASRLPILVAGNSGQHFDSDNYVGAQGAISASTDALAAKALSSVAVTTSSGSVVIGALTGGIAGQRVEIVKVTSANQMTIEHNEGTGNQDILCPDSADIVFDKYGGVVLECNGTNWFVVGGDTVATQTYTRDATAVPDRTLLASASATTINNNNVLAALILDLQARNVIL